MRLILATALILLTSCTIQAQTAPEVTQALSQHAVIINAFVTYIADLQAKGVLPKSEQTKEKL